MSHNTSTLPNPMLLPVPGINEESRNTSSLARGPQSYQQPPSRPTSSSGGDPFKQQEESPRGGQGYLSDSPKQGPLSLSTHPSPQMETHAGLPMPMNRRNTGLGLSEEPLPPLPTARTAEYRHSTRRTVTTGTRRSNVDWIVPMEEDIPEKGRGRTLGERLAPTLAQAESERSKYARKAKVTGWTLNAAIGLQVLLGSLTTGLSAVATSGKSMAIPTTILGALATIVASYLARARGSNEPELSITRTKDLEQFIRECRAFDMDYGHLTGTEHDDRLLGFRRTFEELLGNANG